MKPPIVLASPEERATERDQDQNWNDYLIKSIDPPDEPGEFTVTVGDALVPGNRGFGGWTTTMPWPIEPKPKVGDRLRVWSNGSQNHGVSVLRGTDFVPVYYKTKREQDAEHAAWLADWERQQHEDFEKGKTQLDTQYELLPPALKRRIDRFRAADPDFRWKEEAYEMAACAEAGRLYRAALDPATGVILKKAGIKLPKDLSQPEYSQPKGEGVTDWDDTPENRLRAIDAINGPANNYAYTKLESLFPWIDKGHSGNTWGHAMLFARVLLRDGDEAKL